MNAEWIKSLTKDKTDQFWIARDNFESFQESHHPRKNSYFRKGSSPCHTKSNPT